MAPLERRGLRCLILSFFALLLFSAPPTFAAGSSPDLETLLRKIESRHYRWVAIRAEVLLFFAVSGNSRAMCGGELLYQRLDERILLPCVDSEKNLVFVFRTFDDRFDLYLPSQQTVYRGSIFDMEDSPDIESHLKPRDLYRALKPLAFDPEHTVIERNDTVGTTLNVYNDTPSEKTLARRLYLAPEGDVLGEIYYDAAEKPLTQIQRYDFREIPANVGLFHSIIFPKKITLISPATQKGSAIFFTRVKALDTADPLDFILRVPRGTQEVFLEEKNPPSSSLSPQSLGPSLRQDSPEKTEALEAPPAVKVENADADFVKEAVSPNQEPVPPSGGEPELAEPLEPEGPVAPYLDTPPQKTDPASGPTGTEEKIPLENLPGSTVADEASRG